MAFEIERRFLMKVKDLPPEDGRVSMNITQGYLGDGVRVRLIDMIGLQSECACITIKKNIAHGTNKEFEYPIPVEDARELLKMSLYVLHKKRILYAESINEIYEIDVFKGDLEGLIIVEIELKDIHQEIHIPSFIGKEITGIKEFSNYSLAKALYKNDILEYAATINGS